MNDPTRTIVDDGSGMDRVFKVVGSAHATFRFITVRNGKALRNLFNFVNGGGIAATGSGNSEKWILLIKEISKIFLVRIGSSALVTGPTR